MNIIMFTYFRYTRIYNSSYIIYNFINVYNKLKNIFTTNNKIYNNTETIRDLNIIYFFHLFSVL